MHNKDYPEDKETKPTHVKVSTILCYLQELADWRKVPSAENMHHDLFIKS
jgi:hypothetical protein